VYSECTPSVLRMYSECTQNVLRMYVDSFIQYSRYLFAHIPRKIFYHLPPISPHLQKQPSISIHLYLYTRVPLYVHTYILTHTYQRMRTRAYFSLLVHGRTSAYAHVRASLYLCMCIPELSKEQLFRLRSSYSIT